MSEQLAELSSDLDSYAIFMLDAGGRVVSWNRNAERIKGYRADEIIGRHCSVLYPPELATIGYPDQLLQRAAEEGFVLDEGWRQRKDGSLFWAHVVVTAQRSPDGGLHGFVKVTRDETAAHDERQRASRRFADLFDLTPVALALVNERGQLIDANEALCAMLGYQARDLYSMTVTDLLHPRDRGKSLMGATSPSGDTRTVLRRELVRADGQSVFCDVRQSETVSDKGDYCLLMVFQDVTHLHHQTVLLRHQATHDELTGLLNRTGLNELLSRLLDDPRTATRTAVLYCDIDNFKRVNEWLGHEAGDELLVALARRLRAGLPRECTPGRLYGDEFVIVCSDVDAVGGLDALTRKTADLLRLTVPMYDEQVQVTASIGVALASDSGSSGDHLLRFADAAVFHAKDRGGARVSRISPSMVTTSDGQMHLEGQLRDAIAEGGLDVHYQPIVTRGGVMILAEALVRWEHPDRGLLTPSVILPIAQRGGLLRDLDLYMMRTALRQAVNWPLTEDGPLSVAVNVSRLLPDDPEFAVDVSRIIDESGIDPHRVVLEFVESALIELSNRSRQELGELMARGVRFGIDDFGTGHSSLARLKYVPAEIVKLDRLFISDIEKNAADVAIAHATVDIAHALGLYCIAEGVETASQLKMLDEVRPDAYQGWLFSYPVPSRDFPTLVGRGKVPVPPTTAS